MHRRKYSRHIFENLLCTSLGNVEFYAEVSKLLDENPYFVRGYLELLWIAEEKKDFITYKEILDRCLRFSTKIYQSSTLRDQLSETWTDSDNEDLKEILLLAKERTSWRYFLKKVRLLLQIASIKGLIQVKTVRSPKDPRHLQLIKEIDSADLKAEVQRIAPYWWGMDTDRSDHIAHHRHTRSIFLRKRLTHQVEYKPIDGVHESVETPWVTLSPKLYQTVLTFAKDLNLGLGRVALVKMDPRSQVYRHYDSEEFLKKRKRYHFVLDCGEKNLLESGNNSFFVKEGQLWFFDNKVMHRAQNFSDQPRIHIIFDGYPLGDNLS